MIRYLAKCALPDALKVWSPRPYLSLPADMPPCGYLPGVDDENRILARVFAELCALPTVTERLAHLTATILVHQRRYDMAWDATKGERDPSRVGTSDRSALSRLRPYEAMIEALRIWLEELHERAVSDIGVVFIGKAAKTRVPA